MHMPGENWSMKARSSHEVDMVNFLKGKEEAESRTLMPKRKAVSEGDHVASWNIICELYNVTKLMAKEKLDYWRTEGPLPAAEVPRAMYLTMDQVQKQLRVGWFLRHYIGLNIEIIPDFTHRLANDLKAAAKEAQWSGLQDRGFIVVNIHHAPWQKGAFHMDIAEMGQELSKNAHENDAILAHWWPDIVFEKNYQPEMDSAEGRLYFLKHLSDDPCCKRRGEKASPGNGSASSARGTPPARRPTQYKGTSCRILV